MCSPKSHVKARRTFKIGLESRLPVEMIGASLCMVVSGFSLYIVVVETYFTTRMKAKGATMPSQVLLDLLFPCLVDITKELVSAWNCLIRFAAPPNICRTEMLGEWIEKRGLLCPPCTPQPSVEGGTLCFSCDELLGGPMRIAREALSCVFTRGVSVISTPTSEPDAIRTC